MKYLYQTNKWLIIINTILFLSPYIGLLFLILLGTIQVIMALISIPKFPKLDKNGKIKFIIYLVLTTIILTTLFTKGSWNNSVGKICVISSILLAFLHLNITYLLSKSEKQ
ncbi:MAG: hypothetical protein ABJL44_06515 [Algibacter sp.]